MHFYTRFAAFAAMTIISVASIMAQTTQKWGNTALRVAAAAAVRQDSRTASADSIDAVQAEATASSIMEMPRISVADSLLSDSAAVASVGYIPVATIPNYYFVPAIFDTYRMLDADSLSSVDPLADIPAAGWLMRANAVDTHMQRAKQAYMLKCPESVQYNVAWLPEPPKKFEVVIDPKTQVIDIHEVKVDPMAGADLVAEKIDERHWMHQFSGNIQFSQAYVSPNWYQGGNNNLNIIAHAIWNVKLNQNYHPKLLFDTTIQYKLGMNSAPDDSLRNYSISEDLFQINSTFAVKAAKRWFYSLTFQFKTQLLNSYTSNTRTLRAAFLSPADLNVGVGMTYNYSKKNFTFDASISPLAYNMKICTDRSMDVTAYGIKPGHKTVSQYGSTAELKMRWAIAYNIIWQSRVFFFTDYSYIQADWENTLSFEINRFLTTQIYCHARYDSSTPRTEGDHTWRKFMLKEILSFGFAYKFSTI